MQHMEYTLFANHQRIYLFFCAIAQNNQIALSLNLNNNTNITNIACLKAFFCLQKSYSIESEDLSTVLYGM